MTGSDEKQTSPVHISMSHKITVRHCSIYDVPRAGINISEGTFGGHLIEHCDVFNTVLETGDHGSFNSWGRDRYWTPEINESVPEVNNVADAEKMINGRKVSYWYKSILWAPKGEEFSAFGIDFSSTGVAMEGIAENSVLCKMGFSNEDLIQSVSSVIIKNINDLSNYLLSNKSNKQHEFGVIRNQKKIQLMVNAQLQGVE